MLKENKLKEAYDLLNNADKARLKELFNRSYASFNLFSFNIFFVYFYY